MLLETTWLTSYGLHQACSLFIEATEQQYVGIMFIVCSYCADYELNRHLKLRTVQKSTN